MRQVLLHLDDIGMCQATLTALDRVRVAGIPFSASVMVPCPWFSAVADYCRRHPAVDMGVHLTITAEWEHYRWGPVSTRKPSSGLMASDGGFHRDWSSAASKPRPLAVWREFAAQLILARRAGIRVSHLDNHMGTAFAPRHLANYFRLAFANRLLAFVPRQLDEAKLKELGIGRLLSLAARKLVLPALERRLPLFDACPMLPLDNKTRGWKRLAATLASAPAGRSYVMMHPAADTPELRAICPDWKSRVSDLASLTDPAFNRWMKSSGIRFIRWRDLNRERRLSARA